MESYESVLLVKSETMVYKIPPRTTNRGHRAADWNLNEPHWVGRLRLVSKGKDCVLKLEDKTTGELFAKCPIDQYPGIAIESVTDSSRYFVIRIQDDGGNQFAGRSAFIGLGFADRSDSFDLNVALQDHFKWLKKSEEIEKEKEEPKQELDLRFKEGETIKINMKITKKDGSEVVSRPKTKTNTSTGILPPPPGGVKIAPPPAGSSKNSPATTPSHSAQLPVAGSANLLFDAGQAEASGSSGGASPVQPRSGTGESWGDFTSARSTTPASQPSAPPANSNWVQF